MAIFGLFSRLGAEKRAVEACYSALTQQAREPEFYSQGILADSFDSRFEFLVLHLGVVHKALSLDPELAPLRQRLVERFVQDLDHQLREIGVSDSGIARKMTKTAEHLYGRIKAVAAGLDNRADLSVLASSIQHNLQPPSGQGGAVVLAEYCDHAMTAFENAERGVDLEWCRWPADAITKALDKGTPT